MTGPRSIPVRAGSRPPAQTEEAPAHRTLCRDPDAEARVAQDLARLAAAIDGELGRSLRALLLLGTYARGEGSVIERRGELHAGSCYELLAIVHKLPSGTQRMLQRVAARWSDRLGVDVHLEARTARALEHAAPALTWIDATGGKVELLSGDASVLGRLPRVHPKEAPPEVWATTLCDAATAIAEANLDGVRRAFLGPRDLHEAVLACGDALLLETARYAFTSEGRCAELARIAPQHGLPALARAYAEALDFQARPDRERAMSEAKVSPDVFRASCLELIARAHLRSEHARVGTPEDPLGYALATQRLWHQTSLVSQHSLRTALHAARNADFHATACGGTPRERLARAAVLLAYAPTRLAARTLAARLLEVPMRAGKDPDDVDLYVQLSSLRRRVHAELRDDPLLGARYGRN